MNFEPRDLNELADQVDGYRQGVLAEIGRHPAARVPLDPLETALLAARDLLRAAARQGAHYLTRRDAPDFRAP